MPPIRRPVITLVVNPNAGRGRAARELGQVAAELASGMPGYTLRIQQTTSFSDARMRAVTAVQSSVEPSEGEPPDVLAVMGGDGMASIGLNACADTHVRLGVIPAGTGNDFCRGMAIPTSVKEAVAGIVSGVERRVDLAEVTGALTGGARRRYVGSVVSTGYDAKVNYRTNHRGFSLGSLSYGWDALAELAKFEPLHYRLDLDGAVREEPAMLVAVGNAGVFGGGMKICPFSSPDDGLLDVTVVRPVSRLTLIRLLKSMYSGEFIRDPCVELLRARRVRVDGDDMYAMADGEELGDVPLEVRCAPGALHLLGAASFTPLATFAHHKPISGPLEPADE